MNAMSGEKLYIRYACTSFNKGKMSLSLQMNLFCF